MLWYLKEAALYLYNIIKEAALKTNGGSGPSGLDAYGERDSFVQELRSSYY